MYTNQLVNRVHFFDKTTDWGSATLPKISSSIRIFQGFGANLQWSIKSFSKFYELLFPRKLFSSGW